MKIGKCRNCKYFKKADWSFVLIKWFNIREINHMLFRVAGFCMDKNNPDFNCYAKASGRGIRKSATIFSPKWCRLRKEKRYD